MLPREPEVLALAAIVRYAEARRPARLDCGGVMVPLSDQDPACWLPPLIAEADAYLARAAFLTPGPRALQAAIHSVWCARKSLAEPPPWRRVLALYDALLNYRDDAVVRLNRAVALAEVTGPSSAFEEVAALNVHALADFLPYHAVRADLLRRLERLDEAAAAYDAALALGPASAERRWLIRRKQSLATLS
jgi:RNA polymerase sigma-70 factor, ECF subfamily